MNIQNIIHSSKSVSNGEYCSKIEFKRHPDNPLKIADYLWLFKHREKNGFAKAFIKVSSKNFLVHVPTFLKCLAEWRGA
jgi:hypothetical protein